LKRIVTIAALAACLFVTTGCTREQFREGLLQVGIALSPYLSKTDVAAGEVVDVIEDIRAKCAQIEQVAASVDAIVAAFQPSCKIKTPIARARAGIASICQGQSAVTGSNISRIHVAVSQAYQRVRTAEVQGC
jgi:translation initiation factor 2 gamma subunit (eIF-2gamma)